MLMFDSATDQTKPAAPAEASDAKQNKCSFKLLSQNAEHSESFGKIISLRQFLDVITF